MTYGHDTVALGSWTLGASLGGYTAVPLFDLAYEPGEGLRTLLALVAAIGLVLLLVGLASRIGIGAGSAVVAAAGLGCGLLDALLDVTELRIMTLALGSIGLPILVRAAVRRTGLLGTPALFGGVGLGAIGASITAAVARNVLTVPEAATTVLGLAATLGLLGGVLSAGMAIAAQITTTRPASGPVAAPPLTAGAARQPVPGTPGYDRPAAGAVRPSAAGAGEAPGGPAVAGAAPDGPDRGTRPADGLTAYQRWTLIVGLVGTAISVLGSILVALISG